MTFKELIASTGEDSNFYSVTEVAKLLEDRLPIGYDCTEDCAGDPNSVRLWYEEYDAYIRVDIGEAGYWSDDTVYMVSRDNLPEGELGTDFSTLDEGDFIAEFLPHIQKCKSPEYAFDRYAIKYDTCYRECGEILEALGDRMPIGYHRASTSMGVRFWYAIENPMAPYCFIDFEEPRVLGNTATYISTCFSKPSILKTDFVNLDLEDFIEEIHPYLQKCMEHTVEVEEEEEENEVWNIAEEPMEREPVKEDKVNHPSHYTQGKLEVINIMEDKMSPEEFKGFLKGNVLKYLFRSPHKGTEQEDLEKCSWYLNMLIAILHEENWGE